MISQGRGHAILTCGPYRFNLKKRPLIMGIVNITKDSFSDGNHFLEPKSAFQHAKQLVKQDVDILDLGAESTRPGAKALSSQDELARLLPAFNLIKKLNVPISIDTYKPDVAKVMIQAGAHMINDVSGGRDPEMLQVVAKSGIPIVLMHMQGRPDYMQQAPTYRHVVKDIKRSLLKSINRAKQAGIKDKNIILDPGIGFGKTVNHNLQLIKHLATVRQIGYPILVGPSRKSFIGTITGIQLPSDRDWGTAAAITLCIANGANLVRVHDVEHMVRVSQVAQAIQVGKFIGSKR